MHHVFNYDCRNRNPSDPVALERGTCIRAASFVASRIILLIRVVAVESGRDGASGDAGSEGL